MKKERPSRMGNRRRELWPEAPAPLPDPFIPDDAPHGTIVELGRETPDERIASREFNRLLFQYFHSLSIGATGWGLSFHDWLEIYGWKHHGCARYERIHSIREIADLTPMIQP
jgi:hypothetical protein